METYKINSMPLFYTSTQEQVSVHKSYISYYLNSTISSEFPPSPQDSMEFPSATLTFDQQP